MKRIGFLSLLVFFAAITVVRALPPGGGSGASQKTYRGFEGKVTDENGNVLKNVQITLVSADPNREEDVRYTNLNDGKTWTTSSGEKGRYRFIALRPGYYRVKYSVDGYQTMERLMHFKRSSKDAVMNIQLRKITQAASPAGQ